MNQEDKLYLGHDMHLEIREFPNWAPYCILHKNTTPKMFIEKNQKDDIVFHIHIYATSYGPYRGLVHMVEHWICSELYQGKSGEEVREELEKHHIHYNAFTKGNGIVFTLTLETHFYDRKRERISDDDMKKENPGFLIEKLIPYVDKIQSEEPQTLEELKTGLQIFQEIIRVLVSHQPNIESLQKERSVILNELDLYGDDSSKKINDFYTSICMSPSDVSVIGTKEIIQNTSNEKIQEVFTAVHNPDAIVMISLIVPEFIPNEFIDSIYTILHDELPKFYHSLEKSNTVPELLTDITMIDPNSFTDFDNEKTKIKVWKEDIPKLSEAHIYSKMNVIPGYEMDTLRIQEDLYTILYNWIYNRVRVDDRRFYSLECYFTEYSLFDSRQFIDMKIQLLPEMVENQEDMFQFFTDMKEYLYEKLRKKEWGENNITKIQSDTKLALRSHIKEKIRYPYDDRIMIGAKPYVMSASECLQYIQDQYITKFHDIILTDMDAYMNTIIAPAMQQVLDDMVFLVFIEKKSENPKE